MELKIVGAGLGRTGTTSLKAALEQLTGGRCYHMFEVFQNPGAVPKWHAAVREEHVDWDDLLAGYDTAVDWPVAAFWPELAAANPNAHVLLSSRATPESWWASMEKTIIAIMTSELPPDAEGLREHRAMVTELFERRFTPDWREPAAAMAAYERHNERVRREVAPERLIDWAPGDGWEPICGAIGVPVPAEPFPHVNDSAEFQARMAERVESAG
jgi:hypothetical protein